MEGMLFAYGFSTTGAKAHMGAGMAEILSERLTNQNMMEIMDIDGFIAIFRLKTALFKAKCMDFEAGSDWGGHHSHESFDRLVLPCARLVVLPPAHVEEIHKKWKAEKNTKSGSILPGFHQPRNISHEIEALELLLSLHSKYLKLLQLPHGELRKAYVEAGRLRVYEALQGAREV